MRDGVRRASAVAVAVASLAAVACAPQKPQFEGIDITGADYAKNFHLADPAGRARSLADYRGKVVVLFFGYTQCPDVCPTTMADLKAAMTTLGADADRVQVLFVTLDPQRDTPAVLAQYVPSFDPRFVGLSGDEAATDRTARDFKVFFQRVAGPAPSSASSAALSASASYTVDHTAGSYVFDPSGRIRLFVRQGQSPAAVAHDLKLLLS